MSDKYRVTTFRARHLQALRNLTVHSPGIIQIQSGSKALFYSSGVEKLSPSSLLLCSASASLSFENLPQDGYFQSRMFSFYLPPDAEMLEMSKARSRDLTPPVISRSKSLDVTLEALSSYEISAISEETQKHLVKGLFQQLAEQGVLHYLYPESFTSFSDQLAAFLSQSPGEEHSLESVAANFSVSRATLIRRLKQEDLRYRDLLADVRLNHALKLIQDGTENIAVIANLCGYRSENRFSQRFHGKFGLSPKAYINTLSR